MLGVSTCENMGRKLATLQFDNVLCISRSKKLPNMWIHVGFGMIFYAYSFQACTHNATLGFSLCEHEILGGFYVESTGGTTQNCILGVVYLFVD
jgi:hypothetical protein